MGAHRDGELAALEETVLVEADDLRGGVAHAAQSLSGQNGISEGVVSAQVGGGRGGIPPDDDDSDDDKNVDRDIDDTEKTKKQPQKNCKTIRNRSEMG